MDIEDEDVFFRNAGLLRGFEDIGKEIWLDNKVFDVRCFDCVGQFVCCVGWVCAGEDASRCDRAEKECTVFDL